MVKGRVVIGLMADKFNVVKNVLGVPKMLFPNHEAPIGTPDESVTVKPA